MITVKTSAPIAVDSDDHIHPDGIYLDNNVDYQLINEIGYLFNKKINFLDLGCAGGALVCEMINAGHTAVGIDGSDHCLNFRKEAADKLGMQYPLGYHNWQKYGNSNLFTADITRDFEIQQDGNLMQFDLITAWDVIEHFFPDRIDTFIEQVCKHLKPDGIFIASIATFSLNKHNVEYHKSNFPPQWWLEKLNPHFERVPYPFSVTNRQIVPPFDTSWHLLYCSRKIVR